MPRAVTLFTGQWTDLPLEVMASLASRMGFDGLELACWGDHFDVARAGAEPGYCRTILDLLGRHKLRPVAISSHLVSQAVCDSVDHRHRVILPERIWVDGDAEGIRQRAAEEIKR